MRPAALDSMSADSRREDSDVKNLIVIGISALAAIAASLILISQADATPDQSGQTFAEAKAALAQAGFTAVVATSIGDQLPQDQCTVVRQETTTAPAFAGGGWAGADTTPRVLLSLNCNKPKS